jgi:crotonobetainyl-CoA:carnitine CoA-transferase CaiB-like acyl-CoA transferase
MTGPLAGRVILDCSTLLPGPFLGKLLARQGARVLKIENPSRPDGALAMSPAFYEDLNGMKEKVPLDLTREADRARFAELARGADGLIEGFRPAAKRKLGLDAATLLALNPRLCVASLVGYPEDGPFRERAGHDLNFQALTGALSLSREMPALPLADLLGAYAGAVALASLLARSAATGHGGRVAVSLALEVAEAMSVLAAESRASGRAPRPGETLFSGLYPCYRIYAAGDGRRVAVGAIEPKFWAAACSVLGIPGLAGAGYATGAEGERTIAAVQAAFASRAWKYWAPHFASADCCVEPVLDFSEAVFQTRPKETAS